MAMKLLAGLSMMASALAFGASSTPLDQAKVNTELERFLAVRGDVCLGKFDWPIEVSERDVRFELRDAVQMPVLERLGLVSSTMGTAVRRTDETDETVVVKRYALTPTGQAFYLDRPTSDDPHEPHEPHESRRHADLCAGKLSLDKVTGWTVSAAQADGQEVTVSYTYRFTAAPWMTDAQAQKVFPMITRVMQGQGELQMHQTFRIGEQRWMPVAPGESSR